MKKIEVSETISQLIAEAQVVGNKAQNLRELLNAEASILLAQLALVNEALSHLSEPKPTPKPLSMEDIRAIAEKDFSR